MVLPTTDIHSNHGGHIRGGQDHGIHGNRGVHIHSGHKEHRHQPLVQHQQISFHNGIHGEHRDIHSIHGEQDHGHSHSQGDGHIHSGHKGHQHRHWHQPLVQHQ